MHLTPSSYELACRDPKAGRVECSTHRETRTSAARVWCSRVIAVSREAEAKQVGERSRASPVRVVEPFEDQHARTLAEREAA